MPKSTILEMSPAEPAQMLAALRRARYGYLLGLHILLFMRDGTQPTEMADVLFCSRSSVYRTVRAYRAGTLGLEPDEEGRLSPPSRTTVLARRCGGRWWRCSRRLPGPMAGAAPAGAVPPWPPRCRPHAGSPSRPRRCGAGCTRSAGCGNGPSWWPKTTTHSGCTAWRGSGVYASGSSRLRLWCVRTNSISICYPKSAVPGCLRAAKWR